MVTDGTRVRVTKLMSEVESLDIATALKMVHLCNETRKSYKNLSVTEGMIKERFIFAWTRNAAGQTAGTSIQSPGFKKTVADNGRN